MCRALATSASRAFLGKWQLVQRSKGKQKPLLSSNPLLLFSHPATTLFPVSPCFPCAIFAIRLFSIALPPTHSHRPTIPLTRLARSHIHHQVQHWTPARRSLTPSTSSSSSLTRYDPFQPLFFEEVTTGEAMSGWIIAVGSIPSDPIGFIGIGRGRVFHRFSPRLLSSHG